MSESSSMNGCPMANDDDYQSSNGCPMMNGKMNGGIKGHHSASANILPFTSSEELHYDTYLHLDKILDAHHPVSEEKYGKLIHDEHLFITIHQGMNGKFEFENNILSKILYLFPLLV